MNDGGPRNVHALGGAIELSELFPDEWMEDHTEFESIEEFIEADDVAVPTDATVGELSTRHWDEHVATHTDFDSWSEMVSRAVESYVG
jgi:hypothetical protein